MPRNGSGTYSLPAGQPVTTGTVISSSTFNTLTSDLATALTQSMAIDGQSVPTANLPMGGFKLTGLANGSASTDSVTYGQVQSLISADRKSRNRVINGGMAVDQRNNGAVHTITNGAALAYTVDRFYAYCTGANVTGQRVGGAAVSGGGYPLFRYEITGAGGCTGVGFGTRIERRDCADMAGTSVTLSVDLANSSLTTVNWSVVYANTADGFGTLASPTTTPIASGVFTVNPNMTRYSATIAVPAAARNGLEVRFTVGAQLAGTTWRIGNVQLESGTAASAFDQQLIAEETNNCQRYFQSTRYLSGFDSLVITGQALTTTRIVIAGVTFPVVMRAAPTLTVYSCSSGGSGNGAAGSVCLYNAVSVAVGSSFAVASANPQGFSNRLDTSVGTPLTVGDWYSFTYTADAEL